MDKTTVKEAIEADVVTGDGHSILSPAFYKGYFDLESSGLEKEFSSDTNSSKSTIFVDGEPVQSLKGIYNLEFLYWLAAQCGVEYQSAYGRGTQARRIVTALSEWSNN